MLVVNNIGKRYRYEWIFKNLNYTFEKNKSYALIGSNGSGKSTLLKVLSGIESNSQGNILFDFNNKKHKAEELHQFISFVAPYQELIEEMTLSEFLVFHIKMLQLDKSLIEEIKSVLPFKKGIYSRKISDFSSGMKQRVKIVSGLYAQRPILLLDEPTVNLDTEGVDWYRELIQVNKSEIKIIASNQSHEYDFCDDSINISDYHFSR